MLCDACCGKVTGIMMSGEKNVTISPFVRYKLKSIWMRSVPFIWLTETSFSDI